MTSIWNKNISLFKKRFPALYEMFFSEVESISKKISEKENFLEEENSAKKNSLEKKIKTLNKTFPFCKFAFAKNGSLTASENGLALHSAYNPEREAAAALKDAGEKDILVFAGFGLGYLVCEAAKNFPQKTFVLIEPDKSHFFCALAALDFEEVFKIERLFFAVEAQDAQAATLVQNAGGFENAKIFWTHSQILHAANFFEKFFSRKTKMQNAARANENTLERFGLLWQKNSFRNLSQIGKLGGVKAFFGEAANLPCVIFAAGPTLEEILPHLKKVTERAVTIALDTSLRTLLRAGFEPDFIFLTDPQYWAFRHIAGLCAPHSILVTESAAYPSVFRFSCKKIVLMSSLFPLGKFIESRMGQKGALSSGGSVATSAWEFAKSIGCKKIFFAGLDLGFPQKKTHARGSEFEEAAFANSLRTKTAETSLCKILFSARNFEAKNFFEKKIITDERMKLFCEWFESKIESEKSQSKNASETFVFSKEGLFIRGMNFFSIEDFLKFPKIQKAKNEFLERSLKKNFLDDQNLFQKILCELKNQFEELKKLAERGEQICEKIFCEKESSGNLFFALEKIDKEILESQAKNAAALVFPTQKKLDIILEKTPLPKNPLLKNAAKSRIIYAELKKAAAACLKFL